MFGDPIDLIVWEEATNLRANSWNPNFVLDQELDLLALSILKSGWLHPIVISTNRLIIDGFHRWMLSLEHPGVSKKYRGKVPCVILPVSDAEAMVMTVRINRSRGTHAAVRMSDLVQSLIDEHGVNPLDLARDIGATKEEIDLLYQDSIFKAKNLDKYRYSKAWVPQLIASSKSN